MAANFTALFAFHVIYIWCWCVLLLFTNTMLQKGDLMWFSASYSSSLCIVSVEFFKSWIFIKNCSEIDLFMYWNCGQWALCWVLFVSISMVVCVIRDHSLAHYIQTHSPLLSLDFWSLGSIVWIFVLLQYDKYTVRRTIIGKKKNEQSNHKQNLNLYIESVKNRRRMFVSIWK